MKRFHLVTFLFLALSLLITFTLFDLYKFANYHANTHTSNNGNNDIIFWQQPNNCNCNNSHKQDQNHAVMKSSCENSLFIDLETLVVAMEQKHDDDNDNDNINNNHTNLCRQFRVYMPSIINSAGPSIANNNNNNGNENNYVSNTIIPNIIHFTSKSHCLSTKFHDNLMNWNDQFPSFTIYFHNDEAVHRLLNKFWPEFPHLQLVKPCLISGASMADLWRYLVIYEYGGIYSDIDNSPGPLLIQNLTKLSKTSDALFIQEREGFLSQYFFAATPKHPIMFLSVLSTLYRLMGLLDVGGQYVPVTTGPGALMEGFARFMDRPGSDEKNWKKPNAGLYVGLDNRTVNVVGSKSTSSAWVSRASVHGIDKKLGYQQMGMIPYSKLQKSDNTTCLARIYHAIQIEKQIVNTNNYNNNYINKISLFQYGI